MNLLTRLRAQPLPFAALLGIELLSAEPEKIVGEMTVRPEFCTRPAVLHGGAIMAFADTLGRARDHREFEGWSEHDHDRKQNQLHRRSNCRQPRCRRDDAGPPRRAHDGVANARYDNRGEARCDRDANAASAMRPLLELGSSPLLRRRDHPRGALGRQLRYGRRSRLRRLSGTSPSRHALPATRAGACA